MAHSLMCYYVNCAPSFVPSENNSGVKTLTYHYL